MRVISGKYKGLQLVSFDQDHIRPTTDRVKETLFNILSPYIEESRVLDLFSGTGGLAIESISRGARAVVTVEIHPKSIQIIHKNLSKLKIISGIQIVNMDVFKYIKNFTGEPFQIIIADPPFTKQWAHEVLSTLALHHSLLAPQGIVVIESSRQERVDEDYLPLKRWSTRRFGDKLAHFFILEKDCKGQAPEPQD
ncbi:MAG: 16S rRNA (guanine(966)-N(2))-methyltransferase RsmD [Bdellovibrionales bacterium]|nr:16S rRNA (guanine(966)-N(2))-methyltransferase RsmD [Bdellovibrionales bacterium]